MATDNQTSTILIIDDESIARDVLEGLLHNQGYRLVFAASGPEALAYLEKETPDAILLDVMMPEMDGFTVCRRIKTDPRWQQIPVIIVTILGSKEDLARGFEAGADDFISKPVDALELRARVRSMVRIKRQYDELQAALRLREDLAHMIIHDMRTPLTTILGFSDPALLEHMIPESCVDIFERIHTQAEHLNAYVNDMLLLAKMESGRLILNRTMVEVSELIEHVREFNSTIARLKNITLAFNVPDVSYQLLVDRNLFRRVLDNLISNAIKYSPENSTVTVRVEYANIPAGQPAGGPQVRIQVLDEGPGIAPEDRERIFRKFEIVSLKRRDHTQVGLGLAFCKMVVDAHGGRIFVTGNEPAGSIFTVEM